MTIAFTGRASAPERRRAPVAVSVSILALLTAGFATDALAQDTAPAKADNDVVVVRGFRGSLQSSNIAKKKDDGVVDVIKAEDIGKFPDNNLSESIQRIPGVSIDRDAGEGRTITVRGLGPGFTRVRLNGMEALATTGGRDSSGGANRDRGFDFNVFAAELFQSITVRKASSAETEEGALGATVDLQTPRPFDYKGFTMAASAQVQYNDLSKKTNPRTTFLVSDRWFGGKLGALISVAYSTNDKYEEGPSTTRWENGSTDAQTSANRFHAVSTDGGATFTPIAPTPAASTPGNPGGTLSDLSGPALDVTRALHPRIPRYGHLAYDEGRLGATASLQWRPGDDTLITLDTMFSDFKANRDEQYLEVISFSRAGQGTPKTDIYNYTINGKGEISKASFNNVDVRSENRHDELDTKFQQVNLTINQTIGDRLKLKAFIGHSTSVQNNPEQTTLTLDAYDVNGYSYDYTSPNAPVFNYGTVAGCTVAQACYWQVSSSTAKGDASLIRVRPNRVVDKFGTLALDFDYQLSDHYRLKFGVNRKDFSFNSFDFRRSTATFGENITPAAAAYINANLANFVQTQSLATGGQSWLIPNFQAIKSALHFDCACVDPTYGDWTLSNTGGSRGNNQAASETDNGSYIQLDFKRDVLGIPVRGNVGVRYVVTHQSTSGFIDATHFVAIDREYKDTLPSLTITAEPATNFLVRFAAAKDMARPLLAALTPGGTINFTGRSYTGGNPYLDPTRSNDYDLNFEWYPDKDSLFSVGFFYKDIKTYIQTLSRTAPYGTLGFDLSLGVPFSVDATTPFVVSSPVTTPGGALKGYEINLQKTFTFLPKPFDGLGGVLNYTHVDSQITYLTTTGTTRNNLLNMSPDAYNATLFYENDAFSARISAAYRAGYLSALKPGNNADFQGKNETFNVDAQATWALSKSLTVTLQGLNLTDQYDDRFNAYNSQTFGNVDSNAPLDYVHTGRTVLLGVRYKY